MHIQTVQQTPRLDLGQHGQQRVVGFVVVFGDDVMGQPLFLHHPAAQRKTQFGANGQGVLAQLVQTGLFLRQQVAHACMPGGVQRPIGGKDHASVGAHRAMGKRQLHPLIGFDAARRHRHHIRGGQQPLNKALLGGVHEAVRLPVNVERGGKTGFIAHFAGGLEQGVVKIDEHQRTISCHQRSPAHSTR